MLPAPTLPAIIWSKFMSRAHEGVPVAQLPGTDLVAYLMSQPPAGAVDQGFGEYAASQPATSRRRTSSACAR